MSLLHGVFVAPKFFERFFVANYWFAACDEAVRLLVATLQPRLVVGIGAFAQKRAQEALLGKPTEVGTILHPSPASPAANRNWQGQIEKQLQVLGVQL